MFATARHLVSEAEFLALPESLDKTELIDGEVHVAPSPTANHQYLQAHVLRQLANWAEQVEQPFTVLGAPMDVRFGPTRILQPDVFVLDGRLSRDHTGPIQQVPRLCVEVLSTNRIYDRVTKRMLYAAAGVAEYWCVEPTGVVECWSGDALQTATEHVETLVSRALPGLTLDVAALRR